MKKKLLCAFLVFVLAMGLTVTAFAAGIPFVDVPADAWYYQDVATAYESGLINGRDETHFAPDANLTYAEAVKLAACMNEQYYFGEVDLGGSDPWYQAYVDYCYAEEIISEYYPWNEPASRAGFVEIFAHALPEDALSPRNDIADGSIPDVDMNHPQAAEIYLLYRAGILTGSDPYGTFHPNDNIRRCEVAAILTRMMDDSARKDVTLGGAPAPDGGQNTDITFLVGTWESGGDDGNGNYNPVFETLEIDNAGNWSYTEQITVGAEETFEYSGTIVPDAREPYAFYAVSYNDDTSFFFKFIPANENDFGCDAILWNVGESESTLLRQA